MPPDIRTDDQFWKLIGYVNIYDNPEERPSDFPEFNCMSDGGKFLTYVMGYFEQYTVSPEDYERLPKLTPTYHRYYPKLPPASQQCMLETLGQVEHPQRDPDDTEAWESFNFRVLSGLFLIPIYCLTVEELKAAGLGTSDEEKDYYLCFMQEMGGPPAFINAMTELVTDEAKQRAMEHRSREVEIACSDDEPPQTPGPTQ